VPTEEEEDETSSELAVFHILILMLSDTRWEDENI
jgi:hypothetical protein